MTAILAVLLVGAGGVAVIGQVLMRFPSALQSHLEALKGDDPVFKRALYQEIATRSFSLVYVAEHALILLLAVLLASSLQAIILAVCKLENSWTNSLAHLLALVTAIIGPSLVGHFVKRHIRGASEFEKTDIYYRTFKSRTRPCLYIFAVTPLLIEWVLRH